MQRCLELSLVGYYIVTDCPICTEPSPPPAGTDNEDDLHIDLVNEEGIEEVGEEEDKVDFTEEEEQWVLDPWEKVDVLPDPVREKLKQLQEDKFSIACFSHSPVHLTHFVISCPAPLRD